MAFASVALSYCRRQSSKYRQARRHNSTRSQHMFKDPRLIWLPASLSVRRVDTDCRDVLVIGDHRYGCCPVVERFALLSSLDWYVRKLTHIALLTDKESGHKWQEKPAPSASRPLDTRSSGRPNSGSSTEASLARGRSRRPRTPAPRGPAGRPRVTTANPINPGRSGSAPARMPGTAPGARPAPGIAVGPDPAHGRTDGHDP